MESHFLWHALEIDSVAQPPKISQILIDPHEKRAFLLDAYTVCLFCG